MSYRVSVQPSGHQFEVEPGETVLDAALRQNVGLPYGCRSGNCGSCAGEILQGEAAYPEAEPGFECADEHCCIFCQAVPKSDLVIKVREVENVADIQTRTLPCRVVRIDHLAHDVIRMYLKLPDNQRLQFLAGQYLEFILADGRHRAFSIANAPHDDELIELHIRHVDGGAFTDYVFSKMREKTIQRIQAPMGSFTLNENSDAPMILIAGGTGFAPLKAIIEHAFHRGLTRPMHLFWGVRSRRDLYLPELPRQWEREHDFFRFTPVLSEPDADWSGASGWVHEQVLKEYPSPSGHEIYMAGPPVMIVAAREALRKAGVADDAMYYDAFEYAAPSEGGKD